MKVNVKEVSKKIKNSSLIKRELGKLIKEKLVQLEQDRFFNSDEKIEELAIFDYNKKDFEKFKQSIKPILVEICNEFLG